MQSRQTAIFDTYHYFSSNNDLLYKLTL